MISEANGFNHDIGFADDFNISARPSYWLGEVEVRYVGPNVDLTERAYALASTFELISKVKSSQGMQEAVTKDEYIDGFVERYGKDLPRVIVGNFINQERNRKIARVCFFDMYGVERLTDFDFMSGQDARELGRAEFERFIAHYGDAMYAEERSQELSNIVVSDLIRRRLIAQQQAADRTKV